MVSDAQIAAAQLQAAQQQTAAAWVQAIGAVAAIGVSIWLTLSGQRRAERAVRDADARADAAEEAARLRAQAAEERAQRRHTEDLAAQREALRAERLGEVEALSSIIAEMEQAIQREAPSLSQQPGPTVEFRVAVHYARRCNAALGLIDLPAHTSALVRLALTDAARLTAVAQYEKPWDKGAALSHIGVVASELQRLQNDLDLVREQLSAERAQEAPSAA